jgi:hypothetical protein
MGRATPVAPAQPGRRTIKTRQLARNLGDIPPSVYFARIFVFQASFFVISSSFRRGHQPVRAPLRPCATARISSGRPRLLLSDHTKSRQQDDMPDDSFPDPSEQRPADVHPLNDDTPVRIHAIAEAMRALMQRIAKLAAHEAKTVPSQTGVYPIALLANAEGAILSDENGVPIVVRAPVDVLAFDPTHRTVVFAQPNQLVKRSEAAKIAGTSVSTIKRVEANGELRALKVSERDTSYLMADLNGWMLKRLLANDER